MKKLFSYAVVALLVCQLAACSKKMHFSRSVLVPSAEGQVKIKKDNNNNYSIKVTVSNLASPKKLQPPKETYVVWMQTDNGIKNIGQLKSSSKLFSKALKASLSTVTSFRPEKFIITAEESGNAQHPGVQTVLVTD